MGVVLSHGLTHPWRAVLALALAACVQKVVAVGPPTGGVSGAGGSGASASGGKGGDQEEAATTTGTTSSSGGASGGSGGSGGQPGCGAPMPVGAVHLCNGSGGSGGASSSSGDGGSAGSCDLSLCDTKNHKWTAQCDKEGCKCKFDSQQLCECSYPTSHTKCDPIDSCCPAWPHL